ncbi:MAG: hypothetical protein IPP94_11170 [Ignavibacteria bacterium]|nr:hypothetical protein [Ignavibacteria bacterium]
MAGNALFTRDVPRAALDSSGQSMATSANAARNFREQVLRGMVIAAPGAVGGTHASWKLRFSAQIVICARSMRINLNGAIEHGATREWQAWKNEAAASRAREENILPLRMTSVLACTVMPGSSN